MWALGVLLYQALSLLKHPFERMTQWKMINAILTEGQNNFPSHISPHIMKLIRKLLDKNPD
jgi:serine/threonine protein kinase